MSTSLKRKSDELEDSDDEEPMLGRQVLPVANLPDNFDGVPTDGMQYLFTVRRDARLLPRTTRVANPYEVPQAYSATQMSGTDEAKASCLRKNILPSEEWRNTFLRRFKNFRKNSVQRTIHVHIPDSSTKLIPDRKERDLWWAFLAGRPESEWNPPKKPKQPKFSRWQQRNLKMGVNAWDVIPDVLEDDALPYDPDSSDVPFYSESTPPVATSSASLDVPASLQMPIDATSTGLSRGGSPFTGNGGTLSIYVPRGPTPTLFHKIDHRYAVHLLMYFAHWINLRLEAGHLPLSDITQTHAQWIFCLLSRVDEWLSGDEISTLRTLVRGCTGLMFQRRRHPEVFQKSLIEEGSCWMIITAIIGLWGQTDLWMDIESELSKMEYSSAS